MQYTNALVIVINIIALALYDYTHRISTTNSEPNRVNISIEILCNAYLTFEAMMRVVAYGLVLDPKAYLRNPWNAVNMVSLIATYLNKQKNIYIQKQLGNIGR